MKERIFAYRSHSYLTLKEIDLEKSFFLLLINSFLIVTSFVVAVSIACALNSSLSLKSAMSSGLSVSWLS